MPPKDRSASSAVGEENKNSDPSPAIDPANPETTQTDPDERASDEGTPIHDQLRQDLANADPVDVTLFEEDDNPLDLVGDLVSDEDDANNEKENS